MFTPKLNEAVGFESSWKTEQKLTFSESQTEEIVSKDSECQVIETTEIAVQTDDPPVPVMGERSIDEGSLLAFLQRVTPKVIEELEKQQRSIAFEGYAPVDDDIDTRAALLHTLRWPQLFAQGAVTGLSWSSTGAVVAVSYGAQTHDTWCQHRSAVALWNINRCDSMSNAPERLLEVSSCAPAVAFHPHNPAILALATRTGEVHTYDLSESEIVTAMASGYSGGSAITCLLWRKDDELVAGTQGGHVLVWTLNTVKQSLTLSQAFVVVQEDLPRSLRATGSFADREEGVGITSLSFNVEDESVFVLGVEGGSVLLCSTNLQLVSQVEVGGVQCKRCVVSALSGHSGRVLSAASSPHLRNALITLGSDDQLKLHSLLQTHQPVLTLYSDVALTTAHWSPARALLLATTTTTGQVNFLDVCALQQVDNAIGSLTGAPEAKGEPLLSLPAPEKPAPASAFAFNSSNVSVVAVGDVLGRVWVWRLPTDVVSPHTTDLSRLTALLQRSTEE